MLWVPNKITNVPHLDESMGIHSVRFNVDYHNTGFPQIIESKIP